MKFITTVIFCSMIFGLAVSTIFAPVSEFSETENRILSAMPEISMDTILNGDFEKGYEKYLADNFILRDKWITLKTFAERLLLKREIKDILLADDGYLIERHTGAFDTPIAERNITRLAEFVQRYSELNISVLIIPNAVDILQDKLPLFAETGGGSGYLKRLAENLREGVLFDASSILLQHADEEIYYRTDHHWTTLAAFYVYQAWAEQQGFNVPALSGYHIRTVTENFEGTIQSKLGIHTKGDSIKLFLPVNSSDETLYDYSALETKDKYAVFLGGNEPFMQIKTNSEAKRKILVIKDSYANCFIPFMPGELQEIDVIDLRYTHQRLSTIIAGGGYTDILILYNVSGFAEDMNISKLTR